MVSEAPLESITARPGPRLLPSVLLAVGLLVGAMTLPPAMILAGGGSVDAVASSCQGPTRHLGVTCDGGLSLVSVHASRAAGPSAAARGAMILLAVSVLVWAIAAGPDGWTRPRWAEQRPGSEDLVVPARRGPPRAALVAI